MKISSGEWIGADLADEAFLDVAQCLLARGDIATLPKILILAERHPKLWPSESGQTLLAGILQHLLDALDIGWTPEAIAALEVCPPALARQAFDLLLCAFFPDGIMGDLTELDDAAALCLAVLMGVSGQNGNMTTFVEQVKATRANPGFMRSAGMILDHFAQMAPGEAFKPKLIIWDLDDTLWHGTLADGDEPRLHEERAAFVRAFNRHGIVSAICSKNDAEAARARLGAFGLWEEFVFPRIAFLPKGEVVRQMIADMQLRPANVLFIDDNPRNLQEVAAAAPGIAIMDATSPACDRLLEKILDDHRHIAKSRVTDYRILEAKAAEREHSALTDECFLIESAIHATFTHRMDNLDFADRIEDLINRSNQLNYTASRVAPGSLHHLIMNVSDYDVFCAFVWDKYGYYGLVGTAIYDKKTGELIHFAFSCRIMHMGVEDYLLRALGQRYQRIDLGRLRKPLPAQSSSAITAAPFEDPRVRARVLASEAPRDWSRIRVRLMCDCQSGAFHHYSRFRADMDFDNIPRLFSLPMMLTGQYREQDFPGFLVYTPATDYMDWRWQELTPLIDPAVYAAAAEQFCDMVIAGGRKLLLFLPPEDAPEARYDVIPTASACAMKQRNANFNLLWRTMAARHAAHISCVDLTGIVGEADLMIHAYHYLPSMLQRMTAMIDDWYEAEARATTESSPFPATA